MAGFKKFYQKVIAPRFSGASVSSNIVRVNTVAGLEAAIAAQKSKQIIEIEAGVYQLTKTSSLLVAASYGEMRGIGDVQIDGAAACAKGCLDIDPAVGTGTFKYTFSNIRFRGYSALPGITIDNATIGNKIVVVFDNCSLGGTPAIDQNHTDTTEAIRLYFNGLLGDHRYQGQIDVVPASVDDRYEFKGVELAGGLTSAVVDIACYFLFRNCILKHEGIEGGHASQLISSVASITHTSGVASAADASDFPGAFNPTLVAFD